MKGESLLAAGSWQIGRRLANEEVVPSLNDTKQRLVEV